MPNMLPELTCDPLHEAVSKHFCYDFESAFCDAKPTKFTLPSSNNALLVDDVVNICGDICGGSVRFLVQSTTHG
jgi:hypothetical protein